MGILDSRIELKIVFEKTVRWSLSGLDLTFHGPLFFPNSFSLKSIDLIVQLSFRNESLNFLLLILDFDLPEVIEVVFNVIIWIFALLFSLYFFLLLSWLVFVTKLLLKFFELLFVELVSVILYVLVVFVNLLSVKTNVFFGA